MDKKELGILSVIIAISILALSFAFFGITNYNQAIELVTEEISVDRPLDNSKKLIQIEITGKDEFVRTYETNNGVTKSETFKISELKNKEKVNRINIYNNTHSIFLNLLRLEFIIVINIGSLILIRQTYLSRTS